MTHTPGPWKLFSKEKVNEITGSDALPVVSWNGFDDSRRSKKTHKANARLIAAAPELLEVCETIKEMLQDGTWDDFMPTAMHLLKDVIAKAKTK